MADGDTREALLDAVAALLRTDGIAGLSVRKVAALAGMSHGAPGALFGDRAGLLTAYASRSFLRLAARMRAEVEGAQSATDAVAASGRGYLAFARAEPEALALMFRKDLLHADDPQLSAAYEAAFGVLAGAVRRAVAEGLIAPERASLVRLAAWSLVHGLAALRLTEASPAAVGGLAGEALERAITDLFARSVLGAEPALGAPLA